uniref:Uncharacterized protein n=1 Tax=Branchiostoma floridae TaxID=7739 RepID=C3ZUQ3_BRAFL|eukprot:XP_002587754.1 hypothetical protein BRAFLDRAFT_94658 [Branchiostoma floridae]
MDAAFAKDIPQHFLFQYHENPELEAYLHHYREATALGRGVAQEAQDILMQYPRTAIYTALGQGSHKADQYTSKASLTIPFPCVEFDKVQSCTLLLPLPDTEKHWRN